MLVVSRREYKVMLDHRLFADRKAAAESFLRELNTCTEKLKGVECVRKFGTSIKRRIVFLDTKDKAISLNRFVFRQRSNLDDGRTEYTLKCRSPDRYVASGANVKAGNGLENGIKLEEDIGAPFIVRFSHSNTVDGPGQAPKTLSEASKLFPALKRWKRVHRRN